MTTVSENYKSLAEALACAEKDAKRGFQVDFIIKDSEMVLETIKTLLANGWNFSSINFDIIDYYGEYDITFDAENDIWVEKCYGVRDDGTEFCYALDADIVYISEDCNKEIYAKNCAKAIIQYAIS